MHACVFVRPATQPNIILLPRTTLQYSSSNKETGFFAVRKTTNILNLSLDSGPCEGLGSHVSKRGALRVKSRGYVHTAGNRVSNLISIIFHMLYFNGCLTIWSSDMDTYLFFSKATSDCTFRLHFTRFVYEFVSCRYTKASTFAVLLPYVRDTAFDATSSFSGRMSLGSSGQFTLDIEYNNRLRFSHALK